MEDKIVRLESDHALLERTVEQLNDVVTAQQRQIDRLEREMELLAGKLKNVAAAAQQRPQDDPPPPHYQPLNGS